MAFPTKDYTAWMRNARGNSRKLSLLYGRNRMRENSACLDPACTRTSFEAPDQSMDDSRQSSQELSICLAFRLVRMV